MGFNLKKITLDIERETSKYKNTEGYKVKEDDILFQYDNYACIIEGSRINNIVFLKTDKKHRNSLLEDVKILIDMIDKILDIKLFTIQNKKWGIILDRIKTIRKVYENKEYMIYENIHK